MNENDIELIRKTETLQEIRGILEKFIKNNELAFSFPEINENNKLILWTAIFQHLHNEKFDSIHMLCLSAVRILSRDKDGLDKLLCEKWITILIDKSGLYNYVNSKDTTPTFDSGKEEVFVEALKCLCNLSFNSEVARALCAHTSISQALVGRLKSFVSCIFHEQIILYDMKLLFILTAFRDDIRKSVKYDLNGLHYLTITLEKLVQEALKNQNVSVQNVVGLNGPCYHFLHDHLHVIVCEILKVQFNLIVATDNEKYSKAVEEKIYLELMPILKRLLSFFATDKTKTYELHSHVGNLLTCIPIVLYQHLTPDLESDEVCQNKFLGKNMDALKSLVELLRSRLTQTKSSEMQFEELSPVLTVMLRSARSCRPHRKFLRSEVLPPLRDVSTPPEKGDTLRNMLCKLLTTPVTRIRDLVAEFLFVLCKEKVGRMVKYTGFGNAAGHLAQRGLLAGGRSASSSSDDSDTEEYRRAQPSIDPVVGCTRPPRIDLLEGMSEEQKEYEAMKLVGLFDKLVSQGVMKPARVGPDGRPQPVEHVLELREKPPQRPQS